MKEIRINRLILENFKCHDNLVLDFAGGNASIYGDNATGKTSVYDALTWLLFGKDSHGNGDKVVEIKPLDITGSIRDHMAITQVTAELLVDGEEKVLQRSYKELWSTKRGSSEPTYDGNTSEFAVDGVPCKKNAFQSFVAEIVDEDTWRMLTSVTHFPADLSWQERRRILFDLAGTMDDRQIMESSPEFQPLLAGCGRLNLEDYKKKLLAEKKQYSGAKTDIPARISEQQKLIDQLKQLDFENAKTIHSALSAESEQLQAQILAIDNNASVSQLRMDLRAVQMDLRDLDSRNAKYRAEQQTGPDINAIQRELTTLQRTVAEKESIVHFTQETTIGGIDRDIEDCRKEWANVNARCFVGGVCPTCGQPLPADQLNKAVTEFENRKKNELDRIQGKAGTLKLRRGQAEQRVQELRDSISLAKQGIAEAEQRLMDAQNNQPVVCDLDGYQSEHQALQDKLTEINNNIAGMTMDAAGAKQALTEKIICLNVEIKAQADIIGKESMLDYSRHRIEELRADAKKAAENLDRIEQMLYLIADFARYKAEFVEGSINGLFRLAQFRLFRDQANGGLEDRCDVMLNGVPYPGLNSGAQINVGIDIINTLSQHYGVSVPLFVDNAESVTRLETAASQVIRLVVSENDKELRINYENS